MDESVKLNKKVKKNQLDKKQTNVVSKAQLTPKANTLEVTTKKEQTGYILPSPICSTEVYSDFNIPDILVTTSQKNDALNHKAAQPYAKRKFSGDKTSQDGEIIEEHIDYTEASEERRIRTKSLPQPPSHSSDNDFASAPLPVDIAKKEKEAATQELFNKKFSLATKNDYESAPLSLHTASKLGAKTLTKSIPTITFSEPISLNSYDNNMLRHPVQVVDCQYVNNSPRKILYKRSNSVENDLKLPNKEEESNYLHSLFNSVVAKFGGKNKSQPTTKECNEEDIILPSHPQSQPQMLNQIKQSIALKQNANLSNKSNPESKHNVVQNQKKVAHESKTKMTDGAPGQKFVKLPHEAFVKTNEKNITPPKYENTLKVPNPKLPPTTNLNKPGSKLATNHQNNSELEEMKKLLYSQQNQLNQMMEQAKQQSDAASNFQHNKSNKNSSLNTILQLVQATTEKPSAVLYVAGANHDDPTDSTNKDIYYKTDH